MREIIVNLDSTPSTSPAYPFTGLSSLRQVKTGNNSGSPTLPKTLAKKFLCTNLCSKLPQHLKHIPYFVYIY